MHDFIEVPDLGQVGAGTVVDFIPKNKTILIPRPPNTSQSDEIFTHDVNGDSLYNPDDRHFSASHGDKLICKGRFELSEIKPNRICVVLIIPTCERLAKRVEVKNGQVYLYSLNPNYPVRRYSVDDIEIKGIVLGVTHYWL